MVRLNARTAAAPISRDLAAAQQAFAAGDADLSRAAHAALAADSDAGPASTAGDGATRPRSDSYTEPGHSGGERSVRSSFVFGGTDGASASIALLAAGVALELSGGQLIKLIGGGLLGMGIAHGLREWYKHTLHNENFEHERARERWELLNFEEGESQG